jgi:uncharacterized protein (TIGR02246 family)
MLSGKFEAKAGHVIKRNPTESKASATAPFIMTSSEESAIKELLSTYEKSLNTSDATLSASCYTADGIFMPTTFPAAIGTEGLVASYQAIFANVTLSVVFAVDELKVTGATTAYALTHSEGKVKVNATGDEAPETNREIFLFDKVDGDWKISRYMFNKSS